MACSDYNVLLGIVTLLLAIYYFIRVKYSYWKVRGVKGPKPLPFVGNFGKIFTRKVLMNDYLTELYEKYKSEPLIGIYSGIDPILVVKDPAFIKDVLIKDFSIFANRTKFARDKVSMDMEISAYFCCHLCLLARYLLSR